MECILACLTQLVCDAGIGLLLIGGLTLLYILWQDESPQRRESVGVYTGSLECDTTTHISEEAKHSFRSERTPSENDESLHETILKVRQQQSDSITSLEDSIRRQNEEETLVKELEGCLTRLVDTPDNREIKISVETVLMSDPIHEQGIRLTRDQIESITISVLQDENLNRTVLETVSSIVHTVLQDRGNGVATDIEHLVQTHSDQLSNVNALLTTLENSHVQQQIQTTHTDQHVRKLQQRNERLYAHIEEMKRQITQMQNNESESGIQNRNRLQEIVQEIKEESHRTFVYDVKTLRDMTRRHVETLAHLDTRVCILEEWLTKTCTPEMLALRDNYMLQQGQMRQLLETLKLMEKRLAKTVQENIKHNEIQKQVDSIGDRVRRINDSLNVLLSRENKQ